MGEFGPAAADLDEAERLATRSNRADTLPGIAAGRAELAIWQGRPGDAVRIVREALDRLAATEATFDVPALCALGLRSAADLAEEARARRVTVLLDEAWSAGSGLLDRARGTVGAGAPAAPLANRGQRADLAVCAAEVARLEGEPASGLWAGAAAAWDAIQVPYPAAYARYREGEAILAERGSRGAAADRLSTARLSAATLSAKPLLEAIAALARRARVELEAAVAPSAPSAADRSAAAGRSLGLTARETDVLGLVTLGRTNRQIAQELFITEKTVGVHMTNILGKLGVPGRLDAAAVAQRVGIGPPPPAARELLPESTGEERPAPA
jgi:DNA-binding CsgD family transcriptional regulator